MLVTGRSVKTVGVEVGYRQPSAFVEVFRQTLGMTPKRWVAALELPVTVRATFQARLRVERARRITTKFIKHN
jgi:AraC-like DNA-binding protein